LRQSETKLAFSIPKLGSASIESPSALPPANAAQVYIDFDGTLTQTDVIDQLIFKFAINDSWKEIERLWKLQAIGSAQCLRDELALVRVSDSELEAFVASIRLDPGAVDLFNLITTLDIPLTVVSDGLDYFIQTILERHNIAGADVRCNRMVRIGTSIGIEFPYRQADCEVVAGHCKCASARAVALPLRSSIYIGDGQSDLCAARNASVVFAKNALADLLSREGKSFYPFGTLLDVVTILRQAWLG
jgi:2-hydroxy-3-keto-5-methylthiopentenyl-1-phosphate phosphatase